jgi:hypothetical protein
MFAQDSDMSSPVQYDPNTSVSYAPWEEASMGAVRSYNLTNMATMSSPFSQVMDPMIEARDEAVIESTTRDTQLEEETSREPTMSDEQDMDTDTPSQVGAHTMRAEGDSSMSWKGPVMMGVMALGIVAATYMISGE